MSLIDCPACGTMHDIDRTCAIRVMPIVPPSQEYLEAMQTLIRLAEGAHRLPEARP